MWFTQCELERIFVYHTETRATAKNPPEGSFRWNSVEFLRPGEETILPPLPSFQAKAYQSKQILQNREKYVLFLSLDFRVFLTVASVSIQMWAKV